MTDLQTIEGIGPAFEEKLKAGGIDSCKKLLEVGGTKEGRTRICEDCGMDDARVLKFVNHADLMRVKGVGGEYSELLEAAGVDSVPELAQRNADNLHSKMTEINESKKLVRALPNRDKVADWIEQAKGLPRAVSH